MFRLNFNKIIHKKYPIISHLVFRLHHWQLGAVVTAREAYARACAHAIITTGGDLNCLAFDERWRVRIFCGGCAARGARARAVEFLAGQVLFGAVVVVMFGQSARVARNAARSSRMPRAVPFIYTRAASYVNQVVVTFEKDHRVNTHALACTHSQSAEDVIDQVFIELPPTPVGAASSAQALALSQRGCRTLGHYRVVIGRGGTSATHKHNG